MSQLPPLPTACIPATFDAIRRAAGVLRAGGLVAFPTETVYGLGAAAENSQAVRAMFAAKGRPANHPVIVHLADVSQVDEWALEVSGQVRALAAAFWPGPMTLVVRRTRRASDLVTGGLDAVGLRVPGHPIAQALLQEFGGAVAAPSANRFGQVSPTLARHVMEELAGRVDLVLDGGPCTVGLESTIIDLTGPQPAILRPGGIAAEQIEAVTGPVLGGRNDQPRVSGSLPSHYAPRARIEVVRADEVVARASTLAKTGARVAVLGPSTLAVPEGIILLALADDLAAAAKSLFETLRRVDELGCDVGVTSLPAARGLGVAIADRLIKAAGPRYDDPIM
ncbi:MAG TPA: L-threonylcarbamoyladenylate synthase [Pirellulaceae bacterium]|nr:L-threonylcarbamoyladenylate synthase [Pirellulaceae bacterium]